MMNNEKKTSSEKLMHICNPMPSRRLFLLGITYAAVVTGLLTLGYHMHSSVTLHQSRASSFKGNTRMNDLTKYSPAKLATREIVIQRLISQNASDSARHFRPENIQEFRRLLHEEFPSDLRTFALLHQGNVLPDQDVQFYKEPPESHPLSKSTIPHTAGQAFWNVLPERSPLEGKMFRSCSVVGSGGILKGRGCGRDIDRSDFVFRMNAAPFGREFAQDVGTFANLTTLNGALFSLERFKKKSVCVTHNYTFSKSKDTTEHRLHRIYMVRLPITFPRGLIQNALIGCRMGFSQPLLFGNPEFVYRSNRFWSKFGFRGNVSSGLYAITLALSMCQDTHVYGFWPYSFGASPDGSPVDYHYYDDRIPGPSHNFSLEFAALIHLHELGILKIHMDHCQST